MTTLPSADPASDWGPFSLRGRRALITGGAGGIGRAITQRYVEAGAAVVVVDRDPEGATKLAHLVPEQHYLCLDLATPDAATHAFDAAEQAVGNIDILVNDAALIASCSLAETTAEFLDRIYAINFRAPLLLSAEFARRLDADRDGMIVNIASSGGVRAVRVGSSAYGSLKAALISATAYLAKELGPRIRVNAIAPGSIRSGHDAHRSPEQTQATQLARAAIAERSALGRLGETDEIATLAVFLASNASSYVTGQSILVDGGWLLD